MLDLGKDWNQLPSRNALMEKRGTRTMGTPPPPEVQPPWDIPEAVVVTAAVSGRIVHDFQDDVATSFPLDIGSFQTAAIETIEARACGVHVDFGGINAIAQTGMSVPQIYDRIVSGIDAGTERDWVCDVNVLRGETFAENMFPISAGLGETAPMAPNFPVDWMEAVAQGVTDKGGRLFFSTHSTAEVDLANRLVISKGILVRPTCWIILIGYPYDDATDRLGTYLAHPRAMMTELIQIVDRIREIDDGAFIQVCAAGRAGHYLATTAMLLGLHVRVGTEDTAYRFPHRDELLEGNREMVERAKATAETLGRRLATAAEYRSLLGMPETGIRSG